MALALEQLCKDARDIVSRTGRFIRQEMGKVVEGQVEEKSLNSLVSYVDKQAEEQLVEELQQLLPQSVFLTEEATVNRKEGDLRWIIDPLDGTTNFLYQIPVFSISVALQEEGETVMGIVYELNRQECFYAWKSGGAYLNGRPVHVSSRAPLSDCLIATGFPYYDYEQIKSYFTALESLMQKTRGIRRLGSAAVDLAYVACGRFDAFFEYSLHAWDVAAGAFIVAEAGGQVNDFSGGNNYMFGKQIVAANPLVMAEFMEVIRQAFNQ